MEPEADKNGEEHGTLRRRAEERVRTQAAPAPEELSLQQVRALLNEFRVHQVELEMQNEELRGAQVELELVRALYFELYELAPVGYVSIGSGGKILQANLKAALLFGTDRARIAGLPLSKFILSEDQDVYYRFRRELSKAKRGTRTCELRMRRGDEDFFWARLEAGVAEDAESGARGARLVISDVTERREVERSLRASEAALLAANEELERRAGQLRFLAGELTATEHRERRRLSRTLHDGLQQLLLSAKIRLSGLGASGGAKDVAPALEEIESILDESVRVSRSLSTELSPPILLEGGLAEGLEWLARWMREKQRFGVELAIEERPELDEEMKVFLYESVRELLLNAFKHAKVAGARVRVCRRPERGLLRVVVSDEGLGFDPKRLKPARDAGEGFGLFSIRERIGLVGGTLEIESAPAGGSRFTLTVPLPPGPAAQGPDQEQPSRGDAGKGEDGSSAGGREAVRVLIADDHALFREGLDRMLRKKPGIEVAGHAADGGQAIDLAAKLKPDVILMDIGMPGVNGIEATRAIHRAHPEIRIIGLSMHEDRERAQAMREAGASDYKTKGCAMPELVAAIRGRRLH